ncbi:hypothetical protein D3C76_1400700 [compost metagenome]
MPSQPARRWFKGKRVMARITAHNIRLRKGLKISKQDITSTAINPARINTSSSSLPFPNCIGRGSAMTDSLYVDELAH